jgi:DNA-binding NtrC family response regulator
LGLTPYPAATRRKGEQALGVIERSDGSIDLLITDLILPGMEGAELEPFTPEALVTQIAEVMRQRGVSLPAGHQ